MTGTNGAGTGNSGSLARTFETTWRPNSCSSLLHVFFVRNLSKDLSIARPSVSTWLVTT